MKRVLLVAGGTGGHIFPALAVAERLRARGAEALWLGAGGMEKRLASAYPQSHIPFSPPVGLRGVLALALAVWRACLLLRRLRPGAALCMGGYASAPGGLAAALLRVPLLVHEQNAVAGRANRLLRRFAARALCGFPAALPNAVVVGNPARLDFFKAKTAAGQDGEEAGSRPLRLLVLGGSQGARVFNQTAPRALANFAGACEVLHQCGRGNLDETRQEYAKSAAAVAATISEFINDVAAAMQWADLVLCRAGASTLAELSAAGAAAALVPYPHAAANHQLANARFFANRKAAVCCEEKDFSAAWLADFLRAQTPAERRALARECRALASPQAADIIAGHCLELCHEA